MPNKRPLTILGILCPCKLSRPRTGPSLHRHGARLLLFLLLAGLVVPISAQPPSTLPALASPEIVGGQEALPGAWPWQVALVDPDAPNAFEGLLCAGSLIRPDWVLTAAHCVMDERTGQVDPPDTILVIAGRHQLSTATGQELAVAQVVPHPDFASSGLEDIALLRLATPATLTSAVQPVSLVTAAEAALAAPGVMATVTGWGNTSDGGSDSDVLLQVTVPIVSQAACQAAYDDIGETIYATDLCAGADGKDSCDGDSGGPLVVPNAAGNGFKVAGIVSFGHPDGCGAPGKYGVYARVSAFATWVDSIIGPITYRFQAYLPLLAR